MLDPASECSEHPAMLFRPRASSTAHRGMSTLLVAALLLFAHACALRGSAACAAVSTGENHSAAPAGHDDDCADPDEACRDHDGCDHEAPCDCSHGSICCTTWMQPPAALSVPAPLAIAFDYTTRIPSLRPTDALASRLVPVPTESPPPLILILRL